MSTQALILAGGIGSRLGDLTALTPKPVLDVAGRPFLAYLLWNLKRHGITRIILSVGYRSDTIMKIVGDGSMYGVEITYVIEPERLGTGGGVRFAADHLDDEFLVLNGDTLFDFNYLDLQCHMQDESLAVIALRRVDDVFRYGSILLEDGKIRAFGEKAKSGEGIINGGVYLLKKPVLDFLPEGASSLERDLFPKLAATAQLGGIVYSGYFLDIGLPATFLKAQTELPAWKQTCA
jgi:NDP-sugar pyrophosphorylase family protein